jgi:hypothetical protein
MRSTLTPLKGVSRTSFLTTGRGQRLDLLDCPALHIAQNRGTRLKEAATMGCLFAVIGGLAPRFAFFIYWIMRPAQVDAAFDTWIFPLLGLVFLPLATLLYAVLWTVGGLSGWAWFWVALAAVLDIGHSATAAANRRQFTSS